MYVEDQKIASNYTTGTAANTTNQAGGASAEEAKQEQ